LAQKCDEGQRPKFEARIETARDRVLKEAPTPMNQIVAASG
jgi:hypothetical protein